MKKKRWLLMFGLFLGLFLWKVIIKGYLLGPFDLLAGFYNPYQAIKWGSTALTQAALQYKNPLLSDVVTVMMPFKLFSIDSLKNLSMPLWNPYILSGSPNLANVQSAVLYPLNGLYFLMPAVAAYQTYIISQLFLAFVFMFLYLRTLKLSQMVAYFGALSFAFSTFFVVWLSWGTVGHAFLWLPLILYSIEKMSARWARKYTLLFIVGLVFSFFAGHTQTSIMVWGVAIAYLLFKHWSDRKRLFSYVPLLLIAVLLISMQSLPAIEMYRKSARDIFRTEGFFKDQTLFLSSYLQAFFPDFFGNPVTRNWWGKMNYVESAIYFGTVAFYFVFYELLKIIHQKRKDISLFFLSLMIVGVLLSTQNLLSHLIFALKIPLISSSTFSRYSALFIFGGAGMAAFGLKQYLNDFDKRRITSINQLNVVLIVLLALLWTAILAGLLPQAYINNLAIIRRNSVFPSALIILTILIPYFIKPNRQFLLTVFFIFLLSTELFRFAYKFTPFSPRQFFYPNHDLVKKLQQLTIRDRYIGYLPANVNSIYSIRGAEGAEPLYNKRSGELASLAKTNRMNLTDRAAVSIPEGLYRERILDLMSVAYFVDKTDNFRNSWIDAHGKDDKVYDDRFHEIWTDGTFKIYKNKYALSRQKLFYKTEFITSEEKVFRRLVDPTFDYQQTAITAEKINGLSGKGQGMIVVVEDNPMKQQYQIASSNQAFFVVTDAYYPGWNAYIDGKKSKIIRTNHAFRGVFVTAGKHLVIFKYEPRSFYYGSILSATGLIIMLIYLSKLQKSKI